jgi:predicted transcriptional regulator
MLAVVKTLRTKTQLFEIKGDIPQDVIKDLKKKYTVEVEYDNDDELVEITETDWWKEIRSQMTPGDTMKNYRENLGISQAKLGEKLGGLSRHKISDYENGRRSIGKELAKKLAKHFDISIERLL